MDYQLDPNAAKQADVIFSKIEQKGKYIGVITRAEKVTSKRGTGGVDISFRAETGETADYLTIWTHNGEGKQLQGFNTLMAIMTCLSVRELKAEDGEVEKYDKDTQKRSKVVVPLFKSLMGKPIGLLIHMEEYEKTNGGTAWKPSISAPFNTSEFTASEILNKAKQPETLARMVQALRDRPIKSGYPAAQQRSPSSDNQTSSGAGGSCADFEDDIPFLFNMNTLCDTMGQPLSLWRARYGKVLSVVQANKTDF